MNLDQGGQTKRPILSLKPKPLPETGKSNFDWADTKARMDSALAERDLETVAWIVAMNIPVHKGETEYDIAQTKTLLTDIRLKPLQSKLWGIMVKENTKSGTIRWVYQDEALATLIEDFGWDI